MAATLAQVQAYDTILISQYANVGFQGLNQTIINAAAATLAGYATSSAALTAALPAHNGIVLALAMGLDSPRYAGDLTSQNAVSTSQTHLTTL